MNQFFGAFSTAADGAEEEDGNGAGEEDTGGELENGRVIVSGDE